MSIASPSTVAAKAAAPPDPRRWFALAIIAVAQLMIVVDATIVTIALPSIQRHLGMSNDARQWVITAYTLAFGGLLLLGGRIADYLGRKRTFVVGLIGFAAASALGGLAQDPAMLFAARAIQGAFGALMAPAALSLLTVNFTDSKERAKAFGVFGAIAGGGSAIGLIAGGVLTEYASWRWCLLVNVPIAILTALVAARVLSESRAPSRSDGRPRYDIPGALTATLGLVALVYGTTTAASHGWASTDTIVCLILAVLLLVSFVLIEMRVSTPLLPLRVVTERNRGGSFLTSMLVGGGLFGMFVFLSYYLQGTLHYSALKTGVAFLPFSVGIVVAAGLASYLMPRVAPRIIMCTGLVMAAIGLVIFTTITVDSSYVVHVLPGELVMSLGLGLVFVPLTNVSLIGVRSGDAGVASAMVNATQQVGGSIGTALLNTIFISTSSGYLATHVGPHSVGAAMRQLGATATVHGYVSAFWVAGALLLTGFLVVLFLVNAKTEDVPTDAIPVAEPEVDTAVTPA